MSDATFQYTPLDHGTRSFRLLRLLPGPPDTPIQCELFNAVISEWDDQYIAGSYVWGPPDSQHHIIINGAPVFVRKNLHAFLVVLRASIPRQNRTIFWIDAICIDQTSTSERSHQVGIMDAIYKNAAETYSWLGPSTVDTDWLFDQLSTICMRFKNCVEYPDIDQCIISDLNFWENHSSRRKLRAVSILHDDIMARAYFTRTWIVQEILLARRVTVLCGSKMVPWLGVVCAVSLALDLSSELHLEEQTARKGKRWKNITDSTLHNLLWGRRAIYNGGASTILFADIFRRWGNMECSEAHDRIFALLSIPGKHSEDPSTRHHLIVDYGLDLWEIIGNMLQACPESTPIALAAQFLDYLSPHLTDLRPSTKFYNFKLNIPVYAHFRGPDNFEPESSLILAHDDPSSPSLDAHLPVAELARTHEGIRVLCLCHEVPRAPSDRLQERVYKVVGLESMGTLRNPFDDQLSYVWDASFQNFAPVSSIRISNADFYKGWTVLQTELGPLMEMARSYIEWKDTIHKEWEQRWQDSSQRDKEWRSKRRRIRKFFGEMFGT